jgi:predicted esterase
MLATNPHLAQPVVWRGGPPRPGATTMIALHGRGRSPADILDVWMSIGRDDLTCLAPAADGGTWYPARFLESLARNEPRLGFALERVEALVRELVGQGIEREHIVLMGFSQGACIVSEYALRNPARYGALLIFTGSAIGPEGTPWVVNGSFDGTPALLGGSAQDSQVPLARMQQTAGLLRAHGADVTELYYSGEGHYVSGDEIHLARQMLARLDRPPRHRAEGKHQQPR